MLDVAAIWTPNVQQRNYRALLEAMARPGRVNTILCEEETEASTAILATLLDTEVSLADPDGLLEKHDWLMFQAGKAAPEAADYILCKGSRPVSFQPMLGSLTSPERSATLVISVDSLIEGELKVVLSGPGVNGYLTCGIAGLHPSWFSQRENWVCAFPLGVDLLLVDAAAVLALPRTARVEML